MNIPKNLFKRWKSGMMALTLEQQINAKAVGHLGNVFGICFASIFLWLNGFWFMIFIMLFSAGIEFVSYIGEKQKLEQIKRIRGENNGF